MREDRKKGLTYNEIAKKYAQKNIKPSRELIHLIIANKIWKNAFEEKIKQSKKIEELANFIKNGDNSFLQKKIEDLYLPTRAINSLHNADITTIEQLISYSEVDLMEFDKFGKTSLRHIKERLAQVGLALKDMCTHYIVKYYCYVKSKNGTYWKKIESKTIGTITLQEFYNIISKDRTGTKEIFQKRWSGAKITTFSPDKTKKTVYDYTAKWQY